MKEMMQCTINGCPFFMAADEDWARIQRAGVRDERGPLQALADPCYSSLFSSDDCREYRSLMLSRVSSLYFFIFAG